MSVFSNVKFYWTNPNSGSIRARGTVEVSGTLQVNFSIMEGSKGTFVGLPGRYAEKNGKKEWYSDVKTLSREISKDLNQVVLTAWETDQDQSVPVDEPSGDVSDEDIPF